MFAQGIIEFAISENHHKTLEQNLKAVFINSNCMQVLDLERKHNLETYTQLRGRALADYQGRYIYLINQARGLYWENIGPRS